MIDLVRGQRSVEGKLYIRREGSELQHLRFSEVTDSPDEGWIFERLE